MKRLAFALIALAACGGDDSNTTIDGMGSGSGSAANKVVEVTCPTTADAMVTVNAGGTAYVPMMQTVPVMAVVKFEMTPLHDTNPNMLTTTDPGLKVGFGQTKCLKFTATGTFGFFCSAHSFAGTITVQ